MYNKNNINYLSGIILVSLWLFTALPVFAAKTVSGKKAVVVTATPEAAQAGLEILQQGGNAVDAAAATAFALMVTDPGMCSIGGRAQILIYRNDGKVFGIDGATQSPVIVAPPVKKGYGYQTASIPGSPAALQKMVDAHGSMSFKEIMIPAIRLAREGFTVKEDYARFFRKNETKLKAFAGTRRWFFKKNGELYTKGDTLRQPALAQTLEKIAREGADALYTGSLANSIVEDMRKNGGQVTAGDLAQYQPRKGEIVEGNYRGFTILSRGDQCDGASVVEILHILQYFKMRDFPRRGANCLHLLAQAVYTGNLDEDLPDWQQVSPELALRRVREIDMNRALPVPTKPVKKEGETNHLVVVDAEGNVVSLTQSLGPVFGTKVANPELGFFYAYSYKLNENPLPLYREKTEQSPVILLKNDKPYIVIGSAGSSRIPSSIIQVLVNVLDYKMDLQRALSEPRVFLTSKNLRVETDGLPQTSQERLGQLGYRLREYQQLDGYFGKVQAAQLDSISGTWTGGSDPRDFGAAVGF